jgi:hypothetical protein
VISNLTSILTSSSPRLARAYIVPLEAGTDTVLSGEMKAFQYFPESIKDNKLTNWQPKDVPGLSHPIYQWTSCGPREIGFTVVFTRDNALTAAEKVAPVGQETSDPRNVHIPAAISWLRSFKYPEARNPKMFSNASSFITGKRDSSFFPLPPRKLILGVPGLGLNHGEDSLCTDEIYCIMLQCEVSYDSFFNDGTPRIATVQLNFAEIIQVNGQIRSQQSSMLKTTANYEYNLTDIGVSKGARRTSRSVNGR